MMLRVRRRLYELCENPPRVAGLTLLCAEQTVAAKASVASPSAEGGHQEPLGLPHRVRRSLNKSHVLRLLSRFSEIIVG